MSVIEFPITAKALGESFGATIIGCETVEVSTLAAIKEARKGSLSFVASKKQTFYLDQLQDAVLFTKSEFVRPDLPITYLVVENPQIAFSRVAAHFRPDFRWPGISEKAVIDPKAVLEQGVSVGPFAVVSKGVRVGKGTMVGAFAYLGTNVKVGENCEIFPRVTLLNEVSLGDRVKVFPGAVIGSDGFGFLPEEKGKVLVEMPQVGTVIIEDDVRIGANCTVDRATIGKTRIGQGTKMDDHVHVGHNCQVGKNCVLCGQVGVSGSVELEENVMLGGQVGVSDGIKIGKGARVGGQSGVFTSLKGGNTYSLTPATSMDKALKIIKSLRRLPELVDRVKQLESEFKKG